jgi:hypothetical protein
MGLDTRTYWLTDRQSQCDFDFDYTVKILAANTHCKYFLKIAEHGQYCSLPDPWRNVHP